MYVLKPKLLIIIYAISESKKYKNTRISKFAVFFNGTESDFFLNEEVSD